MQIKETKSSGLKREYNIVVPASYISEKTDKKLMEAGKSAKIPGFRPGKVPLAILKQHYGQRVMGEVLEAVVQDASKQVIEENKLRPALQPEFEVKSFDEGKDLELEMKLENLPEIEVPALDKMKFERITAKVTDKEIDETLERIGQNHRSAKSIEKDRKTKKGDIAVIDFEGRVDGELIQGGSDKGFSLELGSGVFIPGFEDQLIGKNKGDHVKVEVSFPDSYPEKKLAGKHAIFEVDIHDIQEPAELKLDDDLAKKLGFETMKDCREALEKSLHREYDSMAFTHVKRTVLDALEKVSKFDLPEKMVDMEFDAIWQQLLRELGMDQAQGASNDNAAGVQGGKTFEEAAGKSEEELRADYQKIADRRVRLGLLLAEIGRKENVSVSNEELAQALFAAARQYPGKEKEVIDYYRSNENAMASLRAPIFENKVIEYILSKANVTDKEMDIDAIVKLSQADDELGAETPKKKTAAKKDTEKKPAAKKTAAKKDSK